MTGTRYHYTERLAITNQEKEEVAGIDGLEPASRHRAPCLLHTRGKLGELDGGGGVRQVGAQGEGAGGCQCGSREECGDQLILK